jgi:large subunit ribosomal protein L10
MENPRAEKVAVVDEVRKRLGASDAAILTEYRGLTVGDLAALRTALAAVGGEYRIYKNTLVKLAIADTKHQPLEDLLVGPTGITFVSGEVPAVAKALREYSRGNPHLVLKGGVLGEGVLSAADLTALAELPSREVLLARIAGALAAPLQQLAGLVEALPRNLAYGLSALLEKRQAESPEAAGSEAPAAPEPPEALAPEPSEALEPPEAPEALAESVEVSEAPGPEAPTEADDTAEETPAGD